jgi:hypothetical protein
VRLLIPNLNKFGAQLRGGPLGRSDYHILEKMSRLSYESPRLDEMLPTIDTCQRESGPDIASIRHPQIGTQRSHTLNIVDGFGGFCRHQPAMTAGLEL